MTDSKRKDDSSKSLEEKGMRGFFSIRNSEDFARVILIAFIILTLGLFLGNIFISIGIIKLPETTTNNWFSALKDSVIMLGTFLSTIVGYYFGQRQQVKEAETKAANISNEAEELIMRLKKERDTAMDR